jgi:hypothetical protein
MMLQFDTTTTTTTKKIALVVLAGCCVCFVANSDGVNAINIPDQIKQLVEAQIHKKMQPTNNNIVDDEAKAIVVPPVEETVVCEDKHLNKIECKEWAWFGEWYVVHIYILSCLLYIYAVMSLASDLTGSDMIG